MDRLNFTKDEVRELTNRLQKLNGHIDETIVGDLVRGMMYEIICGSKELHQVITVPIEYIVVDILEQFKEKGFETSYVNTREKDQYLVTIVWA